MPTSPTGQCTAVKFEIAAAQGRYLIDIDAISLTRPVHIHGFIAALAQNSLAPGSRILVSTINYIRHCETSPVDSPTIWCITAPTRPGNSARCANAQERRHNRQNELNRDVRGRIHAIGRDVGRLYAVESKRGPSVVTELHRGHGHPHSSATGPDCPNLRSRVENAIRVGSWNEGSVLVLATQSTVRRCQLSRDPLARTIERTRAVT